MEVCLCVCVYFLSKVRALTVMGELMLTGRVGGQGGLGALEADDC